ASRSSALGGLATKMSRYVSARSERALIGCNASCRCCISYATIPDDGAVRHGGHRHAAGRCDDGKAGAVARRRGQRPHADHAGVPGARVPRDPRVTMKVGVADLSRCLIFDSPRFRYPSGRVENFKRDEITGRVVVQNHAGLVLVTLSNGDAVLQYHAERIRPTVVGDLHDLGGPSVNIYDHAYKIHRWRRSIALHAPGSA